MNKLWCDCCKRLKWTRRAKLYFYPGGPRCFACRNHKTNCLNGDKAETSPEPTGISALEGGVR